MKYFGQKFVSPSKFSPGEHTNVAIPYKFGPVHGLSLKQLQGWL